MRSALLCVFFTLITQGKIIHSQSDDFRPTPIPLDEWHYERRDGRAGTLHETFKTDSPPSVAAVPAHYWEDALRHSVYLTLVRDKIDQLIAKGDVISPNSKPESYDSKEIDDHDLWDKIKSAPFDRIQAEEPNSFGDVTIMAKGRLLEDNGGFRFAEDERTKEKCSREKCMEGVKAFWSVKRVRQRDQETSPGKYHYELTFSVISQIPKKQRRPYENPIRTFTVKESSPTGLNDRPQQLRRFGPVPVQTARPERAIWVHQNIAPSKSFTGRKQYYSGLDRIFSSLFSDDDDRSYESPQLKYKQNLYPAQSGSQNSKIGHDGTPVEQYQNPYHFRPHPIQHIRPLQAPPISPVQPHYVDIGSYTTVNSNPYAHYSYDHRVDSSQAVKTTRPAVLPTPLSPTLPHKDLSLEVTNTMSFENTAHTPESIKTHRNYNKYKTPTKGNNFSDHVRPPVYNAPPGVFVTMDKKPFKPMPPLKLVHPDKPHRTNKPIDFRPSPQILEQGSQQGSMSDNSFRPITTIYENNSSPENYNINFTTKKGDNKNQKINGTLRKPLKKHESTKSHRFTTATADIITVPSTSEEEIETMDWTNILGAFTKTTPMISQTEKMELTPEPTTQTMTATVTTIAPKKITTTATEAIQETTISTSTTVKPKKRTRPPPKFAKQDKKAKKHKRITTTTTTTATTPTNASESDIKRKPEHDLTPQASSAATGTSKPIREPINKTTSSSSSSTTTTTTTTNKPTTTTNQMPSTTMNKTISSTQPKNKNRFRQSTLMYKGTSVKHDRWNAIGMQKNQTVTTSNPASFLHRRKGSNFHGYVSSTTPRHTDEESMREKKNHADRKLSIPNQKASTTKISEVTSPATSDLYEQTIDQYESNSVLPIGDRSHENDDSNKNYDDESKDNIEYIFQETTPASYKTEDSLVQVDATSYTPPKNKTKCKKRKNNPPIKEQSTNIDLNTSKVTTLAVIPSFRTTSEIPMTNDVLKEIFSFDFKSNQNENINDKTQSDLVQEESSKLESYLKIDDEIEDFLGLLNDKKESKDSVDDDEEDDDDDEHEDDDEEDNESDSKSDDNNEDEYEESKIPSIDDDYSEYSDYSLKNKKETARLSDNHEKKRPYSFLELMAMT